MQPRRRRVTLSAPSSVFPGGGRTALWAESLAGRPTRAIRFLAQDVAALQPFYPVRAVVNGGGAADDPVAYAVQVIDAKPGQLLVYHRRGGGSMVDACIGLTSVAGAPADLDRAIQVMCVTARGPGADRSIRRHPLWPDGTLLRDPDGRRYLMSSGSRRPVPSDLALVAAGAAASPPITVLTAAELASLPLGPPLTLDKLLLRATGSADRWLILGGVRRLVTSDAALQEAGVAMAAPIEVSAGDLSAVAIGPVLLANQAIVRRAGTALRFVQLDGKLHEIPNDQSLTAIGVALTPPIDLTPAALAMLPVGDPVFDWAATYRLTLADGRMIAIVATPGTVPRVAAVSLPSPGATGMAARIARAAEPYTRLQFRRLTSDGLAIYVPAAQRFLSVTDAGQVTSVPDAPAPAQASILFQLRTGAPNEVALVHPSPPGVLNVAATGGLDLAGVLPVPPTARFTLVKIF